MENYKNFINGRLTASSDDNRIEVAKPSTGAIIATVPESSPAEIEAAFFAVQRHSLPGWRARRFNAREHCARLRQRFEGHAQFARTITEEHPEK
jgi:acyl-CoA reductase-like NAD-dependent aldehyde dehydrogenase